MQTEGLARFATAKYKAATGGNSKTRNMHLTNYSVNKFSKDVPEIMPFPSLEIRDADSVPGMWARVEGTPGAATLHEGEVFPSPGRRPSGRAAEPQPLGADAKRALSEWFWGREFHT